MYLVKTLLLMGMAVSALADKSAPVLVWESAAVSAPALPALPAMSNSQLQKHLNTLDSEALVMFIMNELNVEDFSGYPSAFPQLRKEFESSQSAFTPSMPDPSQLPAHLDSYSRVAVDVEKLASLKLAAGAQKTLFLVYVGDRAAAERQAALQRTDTIISKVLAKVKSLTEKYSAVLTGKHTTMGGETQQRSTRSLKAADDAAAAADTAVFKNMGCVFIYTSAPAVVRFAVKNKDDKSKSPQTWRLDLGDATYTPECNNASGMMAENVVTLTWTPESSTFGGHTLDLTTISLTMTFKSKLTGTKEKVEEDRVSSWTLVPASLNYTGTLDTVVIDKTQPLDFSNVYAPNQFSYHCTNRSWTGKVNVTEGQEVVFSALELPGFQVQAFVTSETPEMFGRAWDCTTFFTIPIWSGLFLSLILLLVLIWSLMMLASVPVMDRFDDPRGQLLQVPTAE